MDTGRKELINLLSWAFEEAEKWLFDSQGKAHDEEEAERIRKILSRHGMYGEDKNWRIEMHRERNG